jgi:putative addiction module CopG family antidote
MEIHIRPELEELIKQDVERGSYASVDEYVEQALSEYHEREAWLTANRAEVEAKIEAGYASAQKGHLLSPEEVRSRMQEWKRTRAQRTASK